MNTFHNVSLMAILSVCLFGCHSNGIDNGGSSTLVGSPIEEINETGSSIDELLPTLRLVWSLQTNGMTDVVLHYHKRQGQVSPRTAEIFISYPEGLDFVGSEKGNVLQNAMKDLIVQEPNTGVLRVIVMGTGNLNTLDSGVLAHLTFQGNMSAGDELFIQERRQYFAPADANIGVTIESNDHPQNLREGK